MIPLSANFEYYKVFYYCARYHNLTAAANKLCLTQPAVTKTIQNLETTLGCRLFIRSKRGVDLTPKGQILYNKIRPACELIFAAESDLSAVNSQVSGSISIAVSEIAARLFLFSKLQKFNRLYPKINIELKYIQPITLDARALTDCDFAVVNTPINISRSYKMMEIVEFEDLFVCGTDYRRLSEAPIALRELTEYPLVLMPHNSSTRTYLDDWCSQFDVKLEPSFEISSLSLATRAIEDNLGIGTTPYECAREGIENGTLFPIRFIEGPMPTRKVCVIIARDRTLGAAANAFLSYLF